MATQKNTKISDEKNPTFNYVSGSNQYNFAAEPIGRGSLGVVYRVTDSSGETYALKLLNDPENAALFEKNNDALLVDNQPHFITVISKGEVEVGSQKSPALLMKYGGYDLAYVLDYLDKNSADIDPIIREAFAYRTMLTVLHALHNLHEKNKTHGDLYPRNILTGLDLSKTFDDTKLLTSEIVLCDRIGVQGGLQPEFASLVHASLAGKNYLQYLYPAADPFDSDMIKATALCKDLLHPYLSSSIDANSLKAMNPDVFGEVIFGFYALDKQKYRRVPPTAQEFITKVESFINQTEYFYTTTMERNGFTVPLVLRPLDMFWRMHNNLTPVTREEFLGLQKASNYSLEKIICKGQKLNDNEKAAINKVYATLVERGVDQLITSINHKIASKKPITETLTKIVKSIADNNDNVATVDKNLAAIEISYNTIHQKLSTQRDRSLLQKLDELLTEQETIQHNKSVYLEHIAQQEKMQKQRQEEIKKYDQNGELTVLKYVRENCLDPIVDSTSRDKIVTKINMVLG